MKKISIYQNKWDSTSKFTITIEQALERIKNGKHKDTILHLRSIESKAQYDVEKGLLSGVCFSGTFETRTDEGLIEHSGMACIDFDNHPDALKLKEELSKDEYVYACWLSPRGNGVKALIKIPASKENHRKHYEALFERYPDSDKTCKNESRLCFESYDPDLYVNKDSKVWTKFVEKKVVEMKRKVANDDEKVFEKLITWQYRRSSYFESGNRNTFIYTLASALCRCGIAKSSAESMIVYKYSIDSDFSQSEMMSAINSAYRTNESQFGSRAFDNEETYYKTIDIKGDIKAYEEEQFNLTDVIFGDSEGVLDVYLNGYGAAETTFFPQIDPYFKWKKGDITLLSGIGNHGKALSLNTLIPTPDGFTTMGEIKVGDKVFDENGQVCNVINATEVMHNRPCYKITFNDGTEVVADENHRWLTSTERSRRSERSYQKRLKKGNTDKQNKGRSQTHKREFESVKTTKDIFESVIANGEFNHGIKYSKPIVLNDSNNVIPPYVLGAWLGDGTSSGGGFTTNDYEVVERISSLGFKVVKSKEQYGYHIHGLIQKLRSIGVLNNKHIPLSYLRDSAENRLELLRGIMDTDGYIGKDGVCEVTSVRKELAENIKELACSLGLKVVIYEGDATIDGVFKSKKYRVCFSTSLDVFHLPRKKEKLPKKVKHDSRKIVKCEKVESVPVRCIEVDSPSHLFLCTKSFIATHNSSFTLQMMLIKSIFNGDKWALFVPENMPSRLFYAELTEMLIGCSIEPENPNRPHISQIEQIQEWLSEHFIVVHPVQNKPTPEYIKSKFLGLIMKYGVTGILFDPFNKLLRDYKSAGDRDDRFLETFLTDLSVFTKHHNIFCVIIAHPTKLHKGLDEKDYPCPNVFNVAGGAAWNNAMDNIGFFHRPYKISEPMNPICQFTSSKIRWKKIVGQEGTVDLYYNFKKRRFYIDNTNPLENNPFNFNTEPVNFEGSRGTVEIKSETSNPYDMSDADHTEILANTFGMDESIDKKKFMVNMKQVMLQYKYPVSKASVFRDYYLKTSKILEKEGDYILNM